MRTKPIIALALAVIATLPLGARPQQPGPEARLQAAITKETIEGDLKTAIEMYQKLADSGDRAVAARALVRMGACYERLGSTEARKAYERVVAQFADQKDAVTQARQKLSAKTRPVDADTSFNERHVWSLPEDADGGNLSGDGRFITSVDWGKSIRVVVHDLTTGRDRTVENLTHCSTAVPSPDGSLIACGWWDDGKGTRELHLVRADGSSTRTLATLSGVPGPADWSPDGKRVLLRIFFTDRQAPWEMAVVSIGDGSLRVLKTGDGVGGQTSPQFSPDGRFIVHAATRRGVDGQPTVSTIHVMAADGSGETPLVQGPPTEKDWGAVWTPDGRGVVFLSDRSGSTALWRIPISDGKPQREPMLVKPETPDLVPMRFAPDGTLYCLRSAVQTDVYVAEIESDTGRVVSAPRRVNQTYVGHTSGPLTWSPDGRSLAFTRSANGKDTLVIHSMDTGEERELAQCPPHVVAWYPNGQSLLAGSPLKRVDVRTGEAEPLVNLANARMGTFGQGAALSHDGKRVFYSATEGHTENDGRHVLRLVRHDLDSGTETEIYRGRSVVATLHSIAVSPDDRQVAFGEVRGQENVIKVVSADGGEAREVFDQSAWGAAWSKDGRRLLLRARSSSTKVALLSVPLDGGAAQPVALRPLFVPIAMNPDGRRLAFTDGTDVSNVVAIKNLLGDTTRRQ